MREWNFGLDNYKAKGKKYITTTLTGVVTLYFQHTFTTYIEESVSLVMPPLYLMKRISKSI